MVGGGELINWWTADTLGEYGISLGCHDAAGQAEDCGGGAWTPSGYVIQTNGHAVNDAVLSVVLNFVREGSVTFHFKLLSEFGEPLRFFVDEKLVFSHNRTTFGFNEVQKEIPVGTHKLEWKFSPFITADERVRRAEISAIKLLGSNWTSQRCEPCPEPLVASEGGSSVCQLCAKDTEWVDASTCEACPDETYRLPGDDQCRRRPACKAYDYHIEYTPCMHDTQTATYVLDDPAICNSADPASEAMPAPAEQACTCPLGFYSDPGTGSCVTCELGQSYDHEAGKCVPDQDGYEAIKVVTFMSPSSEEVDTSPDSGWTTGCSGVCGYVSGWRIFADSADSGVHHSQADSWLMYDTTFIQDGFVSFLWASPSATTAESVLEFFINDVPQQLNYPARRRRSLGNGKGAEDERQDASFTWIREHFKVPAGEARLVWLHHQDAAPAHGEYTSTRSLLRDVEVGGTTLGDRKFPLMVDRRYYGTASGINPTAACKRCPPGTYSTMGARYPPSAHTSPFAYPPFVSECALCPAGEFAPNEASRTCRVCGFGTTPNKALGATECVTDCTWTWEVTTNGTKKNITYDLSSYNRTLVTVGPESATPLRMHVCSKMAQGASYNHCDEPTFVCLTDVNTHQSYSAGTILAAELNDGKGGPTAGLKLIYSFGDNEGCGADLALRQTVVHFTCNPKLNPGSWSLIEENTPCQYHVQAESVYACPVCNDPEDFDEVVGECDGKKRIIEYTPNKPCYGSKNPKTEPCQDISVNLWILLIVALAVFLCIGIMVVIVGYVYISKRRVSSAYELLVSQTANTFEMNKVEEVGSPQDYDDSSE